MEQWLWIFVAFLIIIAAIYVVKNHSSNNQPTDSPEGGAGDVNKLDLHGYRLNEAQDKVKKFLKEREDNNKMEGATQIPLVYIITGQGHHSPNGPVIKPWVEDYLQNNGYTFEYVQGNPGMIKVNLKRIKV